MKLLLPFIVVFILIAAGCTEQLPLRDGVSTPFSLYGVLTPDRDTQWVRVFRPEAFPTASTLDPDEIGVYSTDLTTGERWEWRDTLVGGSQADLAYWTPFRPANGRTYQVQAVRRSDGETSYADVRIPPLVTVRLNEERAPLLQVLFEGEDVRVHKPEAEYVVHKPSHGPDAPRMRVNIAYHGHEERDKNGWDLTLNMIVDYEEIRFIVVADNFCGEVIALDSLTLHVLVGDEMWNPPGGAFDPFVLSQPNRLSNVVNGYGFVGGGYRIALPLFPSREAVESACFIYVW